MGSSHADVDAEGMLAVWSVHLERPEYIFTAASSVLTAHFHKFDSHLVIGGTYSGQILLWDLRSKAMPVQWTSLAAGGHTHPVYSMEIIGSSGAHELVSASTDGKLCHWDMARLQEPRSVRDLSIDLSNVSTGSGTIKCFDSPS
jgi:dynein intermediate chain